MFKIENIKKSILEYNVNRLIVKQTNDLSNTPIQAASKKVETQLVIPSDEKTASECLFIIY